MIELVIRRAANLKKETETELFQCLFFFFCYSNISMYFKLYGSIYCCLYFKHLIKFYLKFVQRLVVSVVLVLAVAMVVLLLLFLLVPWVVLEYRWDATQQTTTNKT